MTKVVPMTDETPDLQIAKCAEKLKVLADPTRLRIIQYLGVEALTVSQLLQRISIPQNLMSHHLRVLREGGLVTATREGKAVRYARADSLSGDGASSVDLGCCKVTFCS